MSRPPIDVDVDVLRKHLAYEVHYLLLAACRFPQIDGREAAVYQDSALLHARNLLEFTKPTQPSNGLWIAELGGNTPTSDSRHRVWLKFINARVTHMGPDRLTDRPWPDEDVAGRLNELAKYALTRIANSLPQTDTAMRVAVMRELANLGLEYLAARDESKLDQIADALNGRLPIQNR